MTEFFIYYTEANIICTVIFVILLGHDLFSVDRQEKQLKYDNALVAFMLYFLSDILTAAVISGYLPKTAFSVAFSRILNYFLMAALTHAWLNYMMAVEQLPHRNRPINRLAVVSPFLVSTIALAVIYLFRPELLFSDALEPTPLFSVFLIAVPIIYILAVVFYTVRLTIHEENAVEKRRHLYIGLFPLLVVIGGLAQLVLLPNSVVHMGHDGVLGAELPVSETEVHGIAVHLLPIDIDCPLRIPDRGRSGGDTVADVGVIACPQREQSGQ